MFTVSPIFAGMEQKVEISSLQNPWIKKVLLLRVKSRERRAKRQFILEGARELQLAAKGGYVIETVLYCPVILPDRELLSFRHLLGPGVVFLSVSAEVYAKMAYRGTTQGVLAVAQGREHGLENLEIVRENPLILVAEAPEKPGNIGALLRTADAARLDAVIIANPRTDLYNPNTIRSSVGCLFTNRVGTGTTLEIIEFLKALGIRIFCAALTASKPYTEADFRGATAIVVGTESEGLSGAWLDEAWQNIIIPMEGEIDSMNVSVSAAILIFEAKRQRSLRRP
jgi:TrmH family RNA methyltransferase